MSLNDRQISWSQRLFMLTPDAVNNGSGTFDDIRLGGAPNEQYMIRFDGIEGTSIKRRRLSGFQASLENVQGPVGSNNYPAEYGTSTGGEISVITRSGSYALHGDLFECVRNNAMDARNFFDQKNNAPLRLNQSGATERCSKPSGKARSWKRLNVFVG